MQMTFLCSKATADAKQNDMSAQHQQELATVQQQLSDAVVRPRVRIREWDGVVVPLYRGGVRGLHLDISLGLGVKLGPSQYRYLRGFGSEFFIH